ncbi:MAG: ferrous iron transport protein B [Myxococcota bacterium]
MSVAPTILLAGNPNAGKTTVFNKLTGARARVGNYPGITVERRSASLELSPGCFIELVDLPGTYSLCARSPEEEVAAQSLWAFQGERAHGVIVVVDATSFERGMYLVSQISELGLPMLIALNMVDEAIARGVSVDSSALSERFGVPVVPMVATKGEGIDELRAGMGSMLRTRKVPEPPALPLASEIRHELETIAAHLAPHRPHSNATSRRAEAAWLLQTLDAQEPSNCPFEDVRAEVLRIRDRAKSAGRNIDEELITARYAQIEGLGVRQAAALPSVRWTDRIDSVLTHPLFGSIFFALVMLIVFESIYTWSIPFMDVIDAAIAGLQLRLSHLIPEGLLQGLILDGVIQGVGNVLIFVPQIAILFALIRLLEDSGYLARVAFLIDRIMRTVGLHGLAFVPLLSGFACAVPAVMATRTLERERDRLLVMLALPLMSCSARLPVYLLVIGTVFDADAPVFGVITQGALALFSMYALSVLATLTAAAVLGRTVLKGEQGTFVLELPPYRMPRLQSLIPAVYSRVRVFVMDAGTIILALSILMWGLLSFPRDSEVSARFEDAREEASRALQGTELTHRLSSLDSEERRIQTQHSAAGRIGKAIEPALLPLGFDWRIGIGILSAFAAREVFVSTLGVVYGIEGAGNDDAAHRTLRQRLLDSRHPNGTRVFTPLAGIALMVFFVLACQCMSTIAVVRRETGTWKWPALMFSYMTVLAYLSALLVYQIGLAIGWGLD